MITLQKYKSNVREIARPNRFLIKYYPPSIFTEALGNPFTDDVRPLTYHTKVAQIPGRTIGEYKIKYGGMEIPIPGDVTYQDLTITALNETGFLVRAFFENWQSLAMDSRQNSRIYAIENIYDASIDIDQLDGEGFIVATYKFMNVFPKEVSSIELSYDSYDSVEEFTVSFGYSRWERIPLGGGGAGSGTSPENIGVPTEDMEETEEYIV